MDHHPTRTNFEATRLRESDLAYYVRSKKIPVQRQVISRKPEVEQELTEDDDDAERQIYRQAPPDHITTTASCSGGSAARHKAQTPECYDMAENESEDDFEDELEEVSRVEVPTTSAAALLTEPTC